MKSRIGIVLVLCLIVAAAAFAAPANRATAVFAGGCFWCEETAFEGVPGVVAVISGYTGGQVPNPTYEQVSSGVTGHAESVQVIYDPSKIGYEKLLDIFWHNIDHCQANGKFCSAIFFKDEGERKAAEASKARLESDARFKGKIVTQIVPASTFYPAEEYHQDFYKKNPVRYHTYRTGCGRDARLKEIWGEAAGGHK